MAANPKLTEGLDLLAGMLEELRAELIRALNATEPLDFETVRTLGMNMDLVVAGIRSAHAKGILDLDAPTSTVSNHASGTIANLVQAGNIDNGVQMGGGQ